jgi:hypothetical protein
VEIFKKVEYMFVAQLRAKLLAIRFCGQKNCSLNAKMFGVARRALAGCVDSTQYRVLVGQTFRAGSIAGLWPVK